jgi:hypothetical protein
LQVGESKVRVAEGIIGRELGELFELGFSLRQLVPLEIADSEHASGVEVFNGRLLGSTSGGGRSYRGREEDSTGSPRHLGHARLLKGAVATPTANL